MNILTRLRRAFRRTSPALCSALPGQNRKPIFVEYDYHAGCYCFKANMPFSKYRRDTVVLCRVSDGVTLANHRARRALIDHIDAALAEPIIMGAEEDAQ